MLTLATAAAEPERGWGGPLAILVAGVLALLIHLVRVNRNAPSPTPPRTRPRGVPSQVNKVPDTTDTEADTDWWGRIVEVGGVRMRQAKAVWKTGDHRLTEDDEEGLEENEVDLALDDPEWQPANLEEWVADRLPDLEGGTLGYTAMVREGMRLWTVSERTIKRRIAEAREAAASPE